jgi:hypothetical protein
MAPPPPSRLTSRAIVEWDCSHPPQVIVVLLAPQLILPLALVQDTADDGVPGHRDPTGVLRLHGYGVIRPCRTEDVFPVDLAVEVVVLGLPVVELMRFPAPRSWRLLAIPTRFCIVRRVVQADF